MQVKKSHPGIAPLLDIYIYIYATHFFDTQKPLFQTSSRVLIYHGNQKPSFLRVTTHILGLKTFMFHGFRLTTGPPGPILFGFTRLPLVFPPCSLSSPLAEALGRRAFPRSRSGGLKQDDRSRLDVPGGT